MGYLGALGMASAAPLDVALGWHLSSNCYPPVPRIMHPLAERAVLAARRGEWDRKLRLPKGVTFRDGRKSVAVSQIVESLRLEAFVDVEGDDELSEQASHYTP